MRRLSSLHATSDSRALLEVSRRGSAPPSPGTIQRSADFSLSSYAGSVTRNTTHLPSGLDTGAPTRFMSQRSSWVIACFASCARTNTGVSGMASATASRAHSCFITFPFGTTEIRSADIEKDLADVLARFHQFMCLPGVNEREARVNRRQQIVRAEERPNVCAQLPSEPAFLLDGLRAQGRRHKPQALLKEVAQVELRFVTSERCNQRNAPRYGAGCDIPCQVRSANHVQNHIGTTATGAVLHCCDEVLAAVVDRALRSHGKTRGALFRAAGSHDDAGTERPGQLDGCRADAARTTVDQQRLPALQLRALKNVVIDGEESLWQCRGLARADAIRNRQTLPRRCNRILCIAAAREQRTYGIADNRRNDVTAAGDDLTGNFKARDVGGPGWRSVATSSLQNVRPVDSGSNDLDQHFACARCRHRSLYRAQDLRSNGLGNLDRRHGAWDDCHEGAGTKC